MDYPIYTPRGYMPLLSGVAYLPREMPLCPFDSVALYFVVDLNLSVSRLEPRLWVRLHVRAPSEGAAHTIARRRPARGYY
jgi:hypothetical protein